MMWHLLLLGIGCVLAIECALIGAAYGDDSHVCGHGPVTIMVATGSCCGCPLTPPVLRHEGGDRYSPQGPDTRVAMCCGCPSFAERWSDWPECGGKQMVGQAR